MRISSVWNVYKRFPSIFFPSALVREGFTFIRYSFCGISLSLQSKLRILVPYQRNTPFSGGSIVTASDLDEGSPSFESATTGSENCTCMEGKFTFEDSSPFGVTETTLNFCVPEPPLPIPASCELPVAPLDLQDAKTNPAIIAATAIDCFFI